MTLALNSPALSQSAHVAALDDTCLKVKQVFFGVNKIAERNAKDIPPFSAEYLARLSAYFDRGCPTAESFPLPKPGTDMSLANTASDVITGGGGLRFKLGQPLVR